MARKEKSRVGSAGHKRNSSCTQKNSPDLQNRQSPWADVSEYNWEAEFRERLDKDADRFKATIEDDRLFFKQNPGREFRLREATPHERYIGLAESQVLVMRLAPKRWHFRFPMECTDNPDIDLSKYDNDGAGQFLFDLARSDPTLLGYAIRLHRRPRNRRRRSHG